MSDDRVAKQDYREVWLRFCRAQLAGDPVEPPEPDSPTPLFDGDDDDLDDAVARHPANGPDEAA